ncbi:MAG: cation-translocating P-type ATPase [Chloroflexia bacterium]|nr:cation-translocating P-type ATPase [Chloroflexia bacterium]
MTVSPATDRVVFDIAGMDCADCAKSVERVVSTLPGVSSASVSFGTGTLTIQPRHDEPETAELARAVGGAVDRAGYTATLREAGAFRTAPRAPWWRNRKLIPAAIALALWIAAMTALHLADQRTLSVALFLAAIAGGGYPIARSAIASLRARRLDMNVLMTISVIGAAALGDWSEGGLVVVLFSIGTTLQAITFDRTRGAIRGLLDSAPDEALVVRNGVDVTVAAADLVVGDIFRIRPGDRLPADGEVVDGVSALQEAAITGESMPVEKRVGDQVFAGTLNGGGTLLVRVTKPVAESMLASIVHLVEEAQAAKAPSQQLVDRFSAVYTPVVVAVAAAIAAYGWAFTDDAGTWVYRSLVLLVIACPCALVISTPVSIVSAIGAATRMGILVKGGAALEEMARVRTIAFDKTGTLTVGRPSVVAVVPFGGETEASVLARAAAVEGPSEHPLARAIVARALHDNLQVPAATAFDSLTGRGAMATVDGARIAIGSDRLLTDHSVGAEDLAAVRRLAEEYGARGQSVLSLLRIDEGGGKVLGAIMVADRIRSGAQPAIERLRASGIRSVAMLTGDREVVANAVAATAGVDEVRADLLPDQKSEAIASLRATGPVAMVGDGVNDAPALAAADVGIAMGMGGTDVALESADIALMRDDLSSLASLVDLANRTLTVIRQNVALSMVTKVAALTLGTLGFVNLWIAVLVDVGTSLVVTLNGLRLARIEAQSVSDVAEQPFEVCACDDESGHQHAQAAD